MRCRCRADPFLTQHAPLFLEQPRLRREFALHLLERIAAAMQIRDQSRGFALFGRDQLARAIDNRFRQAEPARDRNSARSARHAHA